jgi:hypothetical protein
MPIQFLEDAAYWLRERRPPPSWMIRWSWALKWTFSEKNQEKENDRRSVDPEKKS